MLNLEKARAKMEEEGLDVLIALSLPNVYYSTGYYSHFSELVKEHIRPVVLPKDKNLEPFIVCPDFEIEDFKAHSQFKNFVSFPTEVYVKFDPGSGDHYAEAVETSKAIDLSPLKGIDLHTRLVRQPLLFLAKALKDRDLERATLGIDSSLLLPAATWEEIRKALPYATIKDASEIFADLRMVKSVEEIGYLIEAAKVTQKAIESIIPMVKPGAVHSEIIGQLRKAMSGGYSELWELSVDIAGAPATAVTDHKLQNGDILLVDVGARYKKYCADVSRVFPVGKPSKEFRKIYDVAVEAEETMVSKIKPGAKASELYDIGMAIVRKVDPEYRRGHLGHGLGVELHEKPYLAPSLRDVILEPGMVLTVEIPYYWWGHFGVNVEDTLIVTEDGVKYAAGYALSRELTTLI